ncbi:caspase, EACC1-associated type [Actinomadura latina]|uniref:FtsK domain-containing protein n=1 Tax=Actinomadura latina TaxID=163603 RepID=A0A846YYN1_9ACTN|nr:SAV_2336 N-terminal domain-related protein [Actinomadura latina]NKZ03892.1 hypothetical protein [Actinomadura latina]
MTIDRLREALSAIGPPPDARELSEMLWLACHITPAEERPSPAPPPPVAPAPEIRQPPTPATPATPAAPPPHAPEPRTGIHPRPAPGAEPGGEAAEVLVPTAPMLADPLGLQRALRPLKRRIPSRHRRELDEEATAARIADTRLWTPVLVPSPERWLTLALVVDTGPTMRLWRPLARELTEMLIRQGAFQDVHITYLDEAGRIASTPGAPSQDPRTLLDASGRRAVLVLSDCSGPHWWNGHARRAVRHWAQAGPTAILQPLAERLWRRTAAPTAPGLAVLPRPAAPNTDLRFTPFDGAVPPGVPVPVLEPTPRWFAAWARLVSGAAPQPAAVAALPLRAPGPAPVHRERELPVTERVRRFLSTASPDAAELAAHVAVSVPSLPVMRLIQHRILGGSGPGQLAEVLLSGLLRPVGDVRYEFVPGAREALLDTLPRPDALHTRHVLEAVSAEIERRAGTTAETFRALLPRDGGPVTLTADTDHFALVTPRTRTHLAPAPSTDFSGAPDLLDLLGLPVDELLGDGWDRAPRPTVIGADGEEPVALDILNGHPDLPHGLIRAPRAARRWLIRAIVWSLALTHSPNVVNFAFVGFSTRGRSLGDLRNLPHVAADVHDDPADPPPASDVPRILEAEQRRRKSILRSAGVDTWDEYQAAIAEGRALDPLPALLVIIDDAHPLLDPQFDLTDPLARLYGTGSAQGITFIICTPDDLLPPLHLTHLAGWNMGPSGHGGDLAFLHVLARQAHPSFLPARLSAEQSAPIVEQMRRRGPQAYRLGTPAPPSVPAFDVLRLNGGGPSGMFEETWALPASQPRNPAIGYDTEGNALTLYPLEPSSGIPHGLIVGSPESRQRIVRAITLALAAGHSPANLAFAFAGLGEHPLGEPLDLPHVRYSADELLGHPEKLQRFLDYLSRELDARTTASPRGFPEPPPSDSGEDHWPETPPRLLVVADMSLTLPMSRPQVGEALLSLAQRGRSLGVQLLLTSTTVENTTIWDRFLPLLGWRIAAGPRPAAELQRVFGQGGLAFPDERTAYYLLAGGGSPHRFTVAEEPPAPVVESFVRRTRDHWRATPLPADAVAADAEPALADPMRSRAVLIGVSAYTSLPYLPGVLNNLEGLKRVLCDPRVWGLPERNCVVLAEPWSLTQIVDAVDRVAREAEDALLVYYAGHGLRDEADGTLSLALPTSRPGEMHTALPYTWLRRAIDIPDGPKSKVVILDCSFSGLAADDGIQRTSAGSDTFLMTSASRGGHALATPDAAHTSFTGELVALLEEGLEGAPAGLDMRTLHVAVQQRLVSKGHPPGAANYGSSSSARRRLFRNRAHEGDAPAAKGLSEPVKALLEAELRTERADDRGSRHLVFCGRYGPEMLAAAGWYGLRLAERGESRHGRAMATSWRWLVGPDMGGRATPIPVFFLESTGGVLVLQDADDLVTAEGGPIGSAAADEIARMAGEHDDPVIIMCGEEPAMRTLLSMLHPEVADRFRIIAPAEWGDPAPPLPAHLPRSRLAMASQGRIPIGVEYGTQEPAILDFRERPHFVVAGNPGSGRTNVLHLVFDALSTGEEALYVVDPAGGLNDTDFRRPGPPRVSSGTYAATSMQVRSLIGRLLGHLERSPEDEIHLIVDDQDLLDRDLFQPLRPYLSERRFHIVLARTGDGRDPLFGYLDPLACAVLLMGGPTPADRVPGRGVLTQGYESRLIQVAAAF